MKTSNKLLSSAACGIVIGMTVFMLSARNHISFIQDKKIQGNRNVITEVRDIPIINKTLKFNNHFTYVLDPSRNDVQISAESNILSFIQTDINNDVLDITLDQMQTYEVNDPIQLSIGIKDHSTLSIEVDDNAELVHTDLIRLDTLNLFCSNSAIVELHLQCPNLRLELEDMAKVSLTGSAKYLTLIAEDDAIFEANELVIESAIVDLGGHSSTEVNISQRVSGTIEDRAILKYDKEVQVLEIEQKESGRAIGYD